MEVKILINCDNDLWCTECKQKIRTGERFALVYDEDVYGEFEKFYHIDCIPSEDEEDIYISE